MFVPLHRHRSSSPGARPTRTGAVLAAVLGALATGLVGALMDKKQADTGTYVVMGLVIAIAAVACGVTLAKWFGRQGRV